ncbi:aminotransferase class I/II-fold pyridoxal phosphate-dependent enzyme [Silvimonas sp.]|uniref:aminotransferase class I/II-fold pyridoxal phosphate-dependent enzyme n=1 Tax=Silvimonas sp. TaxID=2650811 RepID=UPI00284FCF59|nr:aminotransferase class I/II-fold pyridoxal phosphate-dependent enzyme [Silvimonas sp.]MDR3429886.1 aminotransferase class I/II-fold pyridoxal phosphate-dependent enzyme [Silvimonas sp.]
MQDVTGALPAGELASLNNDDLQRFHAATSERYQAFRARGLKLDSTRGKPSAEQLDLSNGLLAAVDETEAKGGGDLRNYGGGVNGLPQARALFAPLMGAPAEQIVVAENSSLALMHDTIAYALLKGVPGGKPWSAEAVTFLCPAPGYDRHFAICAQYGIRMIAVPMTGTGPDMDLVEKLVAEDVSIKGMWCVPKYSNPTGDIYSAEVVERLAKMKTAAADFRLFWDNAYAVHHLTDTKHEIANILEATAKAGNPDRAFVYASTSKVTLAGAGLALFASSPANVSWLTKNMGFRSIGPDKINQLRHVKFLKDFAGVEALMAKHRALIVPKVNAVLEALERELGGRGVATWTKPDGGYFISFDVREGCAKRTVQLAEEAGVAMVPAGNTFPNGNDPKDTNIRIAPTFPALDGVKLAAEGIALATLVAVAENELKKRGLAD